MFRNNRSNASLIVSVVALVCALGGTSYAVSQLPKNSVGAKQIKKDAVRGSELKSNSVGSSEIKTGAIASGEIANATISEDDLAPSVKDGLGGPKGDKGDKGDPGLPGTAVGFAKVTAAGAFVEANTSLTGASVSRPSDGIYCFELPFEAKNINVTDEFINGADDHIAHGSVTGNVGFCPGDEEAWVRIYDPSAAALANSAFYVTFN